MEYHQATVRLRTSYCRAVQCGGGVLSKCEVLFRYCLFGDVERSLTMSDRASPVSEATMTRSQGGIGTEVWMCLAPFLRFCHVQASTCYLKQSHNTSVRRSDVSRPQPDGSLVQLVFNVVSSLKDTNSECVHLNDLLARVNLSVGTKVTLHSQQLRQILQSLEHQNCVMYDAASGNS